MALLNEGTVTLSTVSTSAMEAPAGRQNDNLTVGILGSPTTADQISNPFAVNWIQAFNGVVCVSIGTERVPDVDMDWDVSTYRIEV